MHRTLNSSVIWPSMMSSGVVVPVKVESVGPGVGPVNVGTSRLIGPGFQPISSALVSGGIASSPFHPPRGGATPSGQSSSSSVMLE